MEKNQLPEEISTVFRELKITKHLRNAGIHKNFGFSSTYLFTLVFSLIFYHKNWFTLVTSKRSDCFPGKDAVYRFLNQSTFAWRRFLLSISSTTIQRVSMLTTHDRPKVFIIDDSTYDRNRSKKVEYLILDI